MVVRSIIEKNEKFYCFHHTQWEVFFQIKFRPRMKFYPFHSGMKFTCKQKFLHPGPSFIPGWDFILVTCKRTLNLTSLNYSGKHLCWSLFLIKLQAWRPENLFKTLVNIAKCLRKAFSESGNHIGSWFCDFEGKIYRTVEYINSVGVYMWKLIS